jgi:hypothetical protein
LVSRETITPDAADVSRETWEPILVQLRLPIIYNVLKAAMGQAIPMGRIGADQTLKNPMIAAGEKTIGIRGEDRVGSGAWKGGRVEGWDGRGKGIGGWGGTGGGESGEDEERRWSGKGFRGRLGF